jgi:hypothetical protein
MHNMTNNCNTTYEIFNSNGKVSERRKSIDKWTEREREREREREKEREREREKKQSRNKKHVST